MVVSLTDLYRQATELGKALDFLGLAELVAEYPEYSKSIDALYQQSAAQYHWELMSCHHQEL